MAALAPLLLAALLSQQFVAAEDEYVLIEARVLAQRHDDGRVEVMLEVRRDGDRWREQITSVHRFLPDPAPIGVWWNSTPPVTVPGVPGQFGITARRSEGGHVELGLQRVTGVHWGERLLPRFGRLDTPRYGSDRVYTSSIDLVDEGPPVCQLGLIVGPGERCRFPDTRDVFAVEPDGSAHYPLQPEGGATAKEDMVFPAERSRIYIVVGFVHGLGHDPHASSVTHGIRIERLEHGRYIFNRLGLDLLRPINGADCVQGLLVSLGGYCAVPGSSAWFIAHSSGLAQFTIGPEQLSWTGDERLELDAELPRAAGRARLHAAREVHGWRIISLDAPPAVAPPPRSIDLGECRMGLVLAPGQSCADPTSAETIWVDQQDGWGFGDLRILAGGLTISGNPARHNASLRRLSGGRWIVQMIALSGGELLEIGRCTIGLVLYPGEECHSGAPGPFQVHQNGLAAFADAIGRERVHTTGIEVTYADGLALHDFTADRRADGGFRITAMRLRVPAREQQVRRDLGDCAPRMILGPGDGCRHPRSGGTLLVDDDGQIAPSTFTPLHRYASAFIPWGLNESELILHRPVNDGRHVVLRVATDQTRSIGNCAVRSVVSPGERCTVSLAESDFYVFPNIAVFGRHASSSHIDARTNMGVRFFELRAERQEGGSYVIRELGSGTIELPRP